MRWLSWLGILNWDYSLGHPPILPSSGVVVFFILELLVFLWHMPTNETPQSYDLGCLWGHNSIDSKFSDLYMRLGYQGRHVWLDSHGCSAILELSHIWRRNNHPLFIMSMGVWPEWGSCCILVGARVIMLTFCHATRVWNPLYGLFGADRW